MTTPVYRENTGPRLVSPTLLVCEAESWPYRARHGTSRVRRCHVGTRRRESRRIAFATPWMTVFDDQVRYADGETEQFTTIRRANFVTVVAVTAEDQWLMVRQARYATGLETLELPQGALEPGESPRQAAAREVAEETGYVLTAITEVWGPFHQAPDWVEHHFHVVLATARPGGDPRPDHREEGLTPVVLSRTELTRMVAGGIITDASTLAAIAVVAAAAN